jgi:hypothetical protein
MQIEFVCDGIKALAKKIIKLGQLIINKNTNEFYMRTQTRLLDDSKRGFHFKDDLCHSSLSSTFERLLS